MAAALDFNDSGNSGATYTVDWSVSNLQKVTLTANCTLTFSNAADGIPLILMLAQDATGTRLATWPAAVKWPAGVAPVLTITAAKIDIVQFVSDGTNFWGFTFGLNY